MNDKSHQTIDKEVNDQLGIAVAQAFDHMVITDADGQILFANKAAEETTGYKLHEMIGHTPKLWGGQMPSSFYQKMWDTIKNKRQDFIGEVKNIRKNGEEYTAELRISPVLDKDGNVAYFVGVERDVTKLKRLEVTKLEFATLASHQLRTPLSTINWYSETLKTGELGKLNAAQTEYVEEIYKASHRMTILVNDLLNLSRIDMDKLIMQPVKLDIRKLIDEMVQEQGSAARKKNIWIGVEVADEITDIVSDIQLFTITITNLLSNAIKYTPHEGSITISFTQDDDWYYLSIRDTGYGIPDKDQPMIFTKFFRAQNALDVSADGTGLGLYIVRAFIEKAGGDISYVTQVNAGTTFKAKVPKILQSKQQKR